MRFPLKKFGVRIERDIQKGLKKGRGYVEVYLVENESKKPVKVILERANEGSVELRLSGNSFTFFRGELVRGHLNGEEFGYFAREEEIPEKIYQKLINADSPRERNWNRSDLPNKIMVSHNGVNFSKRNGYERIDNPDDQSFYVSRGIIQ
jgi:hypothetical protein